MLQALLGAAALPNAAADYWITVSIPFSAALQWSAFSTVDSRVYTSIATTGNLSKLTDALFEAKTHASDITAASRARAYAVIVLGFVVGAIVGAIATHKIHNLAAAIPAACLIDILVSTGIPFRRGPFS